MAEMLASVSCLVSPRKGDAPLSLEHNDNKARTGGALGTLHVFHLHHPCLHVTTSTEVDASPCSGAVRPVDVADPFFSFSICFVLFSHTPGFHFPHYVLCI